MALQELDEAQGWSRRTWALLVLGAVLLLAGGVTFSRLHRKPEAPRLELAKLDRGPVVARVTATGVLSALVTVQVGAQVSGLIAELHADFNSTVKKGQVIAKIDPQLFEAALEQARANYEQAVASLKRAQVQADDLVRIAKREQVLHDQNLVAEADTQTAQANADAAVAAVDSAKAQVDQNHAALHQAEVNLKYTNILAPINGTVISRAVELGQTVASALQAPTLFTIAEDLRRMQVDTSVAEADVGKLEPGQTATFIVDAFPNDRFQGTIRQIRNAATTTQNVVTYDAVIDVENPDLKLRPGMTANCTVVYAQRPDVVRIPNAALRFRPTPEMFPGLTPPSHPKRDGMTLTSGAAGAAGPVAAGHGEGGHGGPSHGGGGEHGNWKVVYALRAGSPTPVRVKVGVTDGTNTELVEGELHEGEEVITNVNTPASAQAAPPQNRPFGMGGPTGSPSGGGRRSAR